MWYDFDIKSFWNPTEKTELTKTSNRKTGVSRIKYMTIKRDPWEIEISVKKKKFDYLKTNFPYSSLFEELLGPPIPFHDDGYRKTERNKVLKLSTVEETSFSSVW